MGAAVSSNSPGDRSAPVCGGLLVAGGADRTLCLPLDALEAVEREAGEGDALEVVGAGVDAGVGVGVGLSVGVGPAVEAAVGAGVSVEITRGATGTGPAVSTGP
uniref:hypothetical protein n=1 Tax=Parerythrobacter lutipelagi TaxID=1964208 RepID=UPI0010F54BFF|nr:hypothetical protein [Parerythrobacter lutipelagi]